jgi:hypothetical protein
MPGADENSAQEVGLVIAACDYLRDELGCTVGPIHHSGKDEGRGARGTSALRGAWDAAFEIKAKNKCLTMTVVDQKEAESGQVLVFDMVEVRVGVGRFSLVPVLRESDHPKAGHPEDPKEPPGGLAGIAYETLTYLLATSDSAILPPHPDMPANVRGVSIEIFRRTFYERIPTRAPEARKKAFSRSVEELQRRRFVGVKDPWIWLQ